MLQLYKKERDHMTNGPFNNERELFKQADDKAKLLRAVYQALDNIVDNCYSDHYDDVTMCSDITDDLEALKDKLGTLC